MAIPIPIALLHNGISERHLQTQPGAACSLCYTCATPVPGAHRDVALSPCCARSSQGFALSVRMPARTQFAGMWLSSHHVQSHRTALTSKGKTAKISAEHAVISGYFCLGFMQNNKKMFSLQTSQSSPSALPLPMRICCLQPAHHLPRTRRGGINSTECFSLLQKEDVLAILDHVPAPLPAVNLGSTSSTPHPGPGQGSKRAHVCNTLQAPMETETQVKD